MFHECYAYHEIRTRVLQLDDYVHLRYIRSMAFDYCHLPARSCHHAKAPVAFSFRSGNVSRIHFADILLQGIQIHVSFVDVCPHRQ